MILMQTAVSQTVKDSVAFSATDSALLLTERPYALVIEKPENPENPLYQTRSVPSSGESYILIAIFAIFCLICFRFNNNYKFIGAIYRNLTEVKERHNVFDDTVRETSFLFLLNLLWCVCAGVILYSLVRFFTPSDIMFTFSAAACMGICIAVSAVYVLFMTGAYLTVGSVFSNSSHAKIWLKGFVASQGVTAILFLPLSIAFICYPTFSGFLLWIAAIAFFLAKFIFIWKGLRIFFTQISSLVLFLYYLCSLEIVPLILIYFIALYFCRL